MDDEREISAKDQSPFIWNELVTADQKSSGAFFSQLFGWSCKEVEAGPFGIYPLFQRNGQDVAGMMNPTPDTPGKGGVASEHKAQRNFDETRLAILRFISAA